MDKLSFALQLYPFPHTHERWKIIAAWRFLACRQGPFDKWFCLSLRERCYQIAPFAEKKATIGH